MNETALRLPQQDGGWFLTDAGIETVLTFQEGIALPEFAAFVLVESQEGRASLQRYFRRYLALAATTPNGSAISMTFLSSMRLITPTVFIGLMNS